MPTFFNLLDEASSLGGAGVLRASQLNGASAAGISAVTTTTDNGTNIQVTSTAGGQALVWFTEPLTNGVTLPGTAGTVTPFIRGRQSTSNVNAGAAITIDRCDNAGTVISNILTTAAIGSEYTTSDATKSLSYSGTATTLAAGDRIKFTLRVVNIGTMGAGTVTNVYASRAGNTYVRFTPDFRTDEVIEINQYQGAGRYGYN